MKIAKIFDHENMIILVDFCMIDWHFIIIGNVSIYVNIKELHMLILGE